MATTSLSTFTTLANKWLNRLAPLLLLLAVLWLCWNIARIVWLFLAPPTAPILPPIARQANINTQATPPSTLTIFGNAPIVKKQPKQPPRPPTNITVKGVMTAEPLANSSALIGVNGTIKNYRLGKQLENTPYTLVNVEWNQITLADKQQNRTTIKLNEPMELNQEFVAKNTQKRRTGSTANRRVPSSRNNTNSVNNSANNSTANKAIPRPPAPSSTTPAATNNTANANNQTNNATNNKAAVDKKSQANNAMSNAINKLKQDPAGYLSQMGVTSSSQGYEVTNAMPEKIRNRIGLKAGDRVLSVNGYNVGSNPTADADLLKKVQEAGKAQIQVQRGEQVITIRQQF